jgi:hypothetical protein
VPTGSEAIASLTVYNCKPIIGLLPLNAGGAIRKPADNIEDALIKDLLVVMIVNFKLTELFCYC